MPQPVQRGFRHLLPVALLALLACGDDDGGRARDAGATDAGPCPTDPVAAPTMAACDAATRTCIDGCADGDDACVTACVMADPAAALCSPCLNQAVIACGNDMGCQDEWDELGCCTDAECGGTLDETCSGGPCAGELDAFRSCLEALGDACAPATDVCYRP